MGAGWGSGFSTWRGPIVADLWLWLRTPRAPRKGEPYGSVPLLGWSGHRGRHGSRGPLEIRRLSWLPPGPNGSQGGLHPAKTTSVVLSKSRGLKPSLSFCWYRQGQTEARCLGHQDQESHHGIQIQEAFDSTVASVCSHRSDPGVCSRVHLSSSEVFAAHGQMGCPPLVCGVCMFAPAASCQPALLLSLRPGPVLMYANVCRWDEEMWEGMEDQRGKEMGVSRGMGCMCIKHFPPTSAENFGCVLESPGRFKNLPMPWSSPQINYIRFLGEGIN